MILHRAAAWIAGALAVAGGLAGCSGAGPTSVVQGGPAEAAVGNAEAGDIGAENALRGDRGWRSAKRNSLDWQAMSGFADRSSVFPGQQVRLFVSTTARSWRLSAYRMGWYSGSEGRLVWTSQPLRGVAQTATGYLPATRTHYADWRESTSVDTTGWPPGMYLLRLVGANRAEWLVPLVVRSPEVVGRVVLVMSDLTWQAYNDWGGRSSYLGAGGREDRSRAVSFARPYAAGSGTGKYLAYEHPVVRLAERSGVPVSYLAASDLDSDAQALRGAEGLVSLGHNEYWTAAERSHVTAARDAGTDLAFLGANTMYWRTRLSDGPAGGRLMSIYKSAEEDPVRGADSTARFRDPPNPDPERGLVGQDYECYPATGSYTVTDPDFFLFRGTGIRRDGTVPGILEVEVDRAYPLPGTPRNLQIVAASPTRCAAAQTLSTSSYYSTASGAGVFATGTMGWVLRGLRGTAPAKGREFTERVTEALLRAMAQGPMGTAHPSTGNLARFDLSSVNTTGAA